MNREFTAGNRGTSVLRLQNYDNFDSLWDRLNQLSQSPDSPKRVVLIWPPRGGVLHDPVAFSILRSRLSRRGMECIIVSTNEQIRSLARFCHIPLALSQQEAELVDISSEKPFRRRESPEQRGLRLSELHQEAEVSKRSDLSRRFLLPFLSLFLLVLAAGFVIFVPHVEILVTPPYVTQKMALSLWTSDSVETAGLNGALPSEVKTLSLEFSAQVPTTGVVNGNMGLAVGRVSLRNRCQQLKSLMKGTRLSGVDPLVPAFMSLETLRLDPDEIGSVRVQAVMGGTGGNVPVGTQLIADGMNSDCFEIVAEADFHGGTDGFYAAPCEADRELAEREIYNQIRGAVADTLKTHFGDDFLMIESPQVIQVSSEQMLPEFGYQSEKLTLRQKLELSVRVIRRDEMEGLIRQMMDLEENIRGSGAIHYETLTAPYTDGDRVLWELSAERRAYREETNEEAVQLILKGKTITEAQRILDEMTAGAPAQIRIFPQGFPFLPLRGGSIHVRFMPSETVAD